MVVVEAQNLMLEGNDTQLAVGLVDNTVIVTGVEVA